MKEKIKIRNIRGLNLSAVIHYQDKKEKSPCVLVLHGFLGNKEAKHIVAICEMLCEKGIVAIRFDCSGFGESDGSPENDFRVSNYLSDISDVFDYAKSLPFIEPSEIAIAGHSLGASLSLIFTATHEEIKACCAIQPATKLTRVDSPLDIKKWKETGWFEELCSEPVERLVRLPYAMAEDADRFNALDYVNRIKVPTMILYGTEDQAVLPNNTLSLYEAANNCEKELVKLEGVDHYFKNDPAKLKTVLRHVGDFFQKHLAVDKQVNARL